MSDGSVSSDSSTLITDCASVILGTGRGGAAVSGPSQKRNIDEHCPSAQLHGAATNKHTKKLHFDPSVEAGRSGAHGMNRGGGMIAVGAIDGLTAASPDTNNASTHVAPADHRDVIDAVNRRGTDRGMKPAMCGGDIVVEDPAAYQPGTPILGWAHPRRSPHPPKCQFWLCLTVWFTLCMIISALVPMYIMITRSSHQTGVLSSSPARHEADAARSKIFDNTTSAFLAGETGSNSSYGTPIPFPSAPTTLATGGSFLFIAVWIPLSSLLTAVIVYVSTTRHFQQLVQLFDSIHSIYPDMDAVAESIIRDNRFSRFEEPYRVQVNACLMFCRLLKHYHLVLSSFNDSHHSPQYESPSAIVRRPNSFTEHAKLNNNSNNNSNSQHHHRSDVYRRKSDHGDTTVTSSELTRCWTHSGKSMLQSRQEYGGGGQEMFPSHASVCSDKAQYSGRRSSSQPSPAAQCSSAVAAVDSGTLCRANSIGSSSEYHQASSTGRNTFDREECLFLESIAPHSANASRIILGQHLQQQCAQPPQYDLCSYTHDQQTQPVDIAAFSSRAMFSCEWSASGTSLSDDDDNDNDKHDGNPEEKNRNNALRAQKTHSPAKSSGNNADGPRRCCQGATSSLSPRPASKECDGGKKTPSSNERAVHYQDRSSTAHSANTPSTATLALSPPPLSGASMLISGDPLNDNEKPWQDVLSVKTPDDANNQNKSIILQLLKQVKIGDDLSRVVLPIHILEPRSLLEKLSDLFVHPELLGLLAANEEDDTSNAEPQTHIPIEERRLLAFVRWFISGFHMRPSGVRKPYNPILGETFECVFAEGTPNAVHYIAEQVSHHPPISCFKAVHLGTGNEVTGSYVPRSKLLSPNTGASIGEGSISAYCPATERRYTVGWPNAQVSGIAIAPMRLELVGKVTVTTNAPGLCATLVWEGKPYFGGTYDEFVAKVYNMNTGTGSPQTPGALLEGPPKGSRPTCTLTGKWWSTITSTRSAGGSSKSSSATTCSVFFNPDTLTALRPRAIKTALPKPSRVVWSGVTEALRLGDAALAQTRKQGIEGVEREYRRAREARGEEALPKYFRIVGEKKPPGKNIWRYTGSPAHISSAQ